MGRQGEPWEKNNNIWNKYPLHLFLCGYDEHNDYKAHEETFLTGRLAV